MPFGDATGIVGEIEQRRAKPFRKETFDVVSIAAYSFFATVLSD